MSRIAVVTGLQLEARLLTPRGRAAHGAFPYVYCTGGSRIRCAEKVDQAVARGALGLVSFGVVGALDPGLAPGTLLLPEAVVDQDGEVWDCEKSWRAAARAMIGADVVIAEGPLLTVDRVIRTPEQKRICRVSSGAVAVDMESAWLAQAARAAGLPFIVIRAVADTATQALPMLAANAMRPDGSLDVRALALGLMRRPGEIRELLGTARQTAAAKQTLARVADLGLPVFGLR